MKITLVRHAEVLESYQGKYNGHIDISLSENGKLQAKELANKLQDEDFDRIYCSDLLRAKETLDAFEIKIEPIFTSRLREKSWGIHEGKSFDEIQDSGIIYENFEQWIKALDGEDIYEYKDNAKDFLYNTILSSKSKNILIVTHSGFIKTILSIVKKYSLEDAFSIKLPYSSFVVINEENLIFN